MQKGTIKTFIEDRGFGFIKPDDGEHRDLFFHVRSLVTKAQPSVGDRVSYELANNSRTGRVQAVGVTLLGWPIISGGA